MSQVTRDATFKVKRSKVNLQGAGHSLFYSILRCVMYYITVSLSSCPFRPISPVVIFLQCFEADSNTVAEKN